MGCVEIDIAALVNAVAMSVIAAESELSLLDAAIGDADHGLNMRRGFDAVRAQCDDYAALSPADAMKEIGHTLIMKVGGASGPLYGTLFQSFGEHLHETPSRANVAEAMTKAVACLQELGKVELNNKTMFDVLAPLADHLSSTDVSAVSVRALAHRQAQATIHMRAKRGRAAYLGERSVGHMDPGARSSEIMIVAVCDALEAAYGV
jgi:phosphoenolpyruvate---glycerone phosphotransferase subunit DhaL